MRKKSIWSGVIMLMILSWVGGCTYAQETVEVVDVEVCPEVPACPDCVLTCPDAPECDAEVPKIHIRAIDKPHQVRLEFGNRAALVGYTWNRNGRIKPSASLIHDGQSSVLVESRYSYYNSASTVVGRDRTILTVGVAIGLGKRHGLISGATASD